mmetsp:Transcript_22326/g.31243  ORF Transcript_22326/g.31243 Transcript_22326/m.31243 type:complete len:299 (+) Transcript_22326:106-1002(+)
MQLVRVEPQSLRMTLTPNVKTHGILKIHNVSESLVAYKVKTRHPERYSVGNNNGIIQPGNRGDVKIVVEPMSQLPETDVKDKFLVMYMEIKEKPEDLSKMWKDYEIEQKGQPPGTIYFQQKIKCRLQPPANFNAANPSIKGRSEVTRNNGAPDNFSTETNPPPEYDAAKPHQYEEPDSRDPADSRNEQSYYVDLQRKNEEYEELMTYTVKLANENEELKRELAKLKEGDGSMSKVIAEQKSTIFELERENDKLRSRTRNDISIGDQRVQAASKGNISFRYWELAIFTVVLALVMRYAL